MPETIEGQPKAAQNVIKVPIPANVSGELKEGLEVLKSPEIHEKLAEQGLMIDQQAFQQAVQDLAPEAKIEMLPADNKMPVVSIQEELDSIKDQVNNALSTIIDMVVGLEERFDTLDQRIVEFNRKGGHKL